jgi:acetylornithine deacetylase
VDDRGDNSVNDVLELLDHLISFPTISRESNLPLIEFVATYLGGFGMPVQLFHNQSRDKAGLYYCIGPRIAGGVILSGHTDVVPVDGQTWASDPFRLVRRGDRLFGRGSADMKGFLACVLAMTKQATSKKLMRPLHVVMSYDEEIGCVGVRHMLTALQSMLLAPALGIIGEPTQLLIAIAHKGKSAARIHCRGHACHSSRAPEGLNAIYLATEMVTFLRQLQDDIIRRGERDATFLVPFSSVHVGMINGGTALNIVPSDCSVEVEIRNLPSDDPQALLDQICAKARDLTQFCRQRFDDTGVDVDVFNAYPGLSAPVDAPMVRLAGKFCDALGTCSVDFGTEGGLFQQRLGIPVVVCGPGHIADAHKADESIALDQLAGCKRMLGRILNWLAEP